MARKSLTRSLGSPPRADDHAGIDRWVRAVHEVLVAGEGFKGGEGSPDRYLKLKDLTEAGAKALSKFGSGYAGGTTYTGLSSQAVVSDPIPYTPPPVVTNVTAVGGINNIFVEWDHPPSYNLYLTYYEVWRAETDDLGAAISVGQPAGRLYLDPVGPGSPTYYYWVRAVSEREDISAFNAVNGVSAQTAMDPEYVVSLLEGRISDTELNQSLNEAIVLTGDNKAAIEAQQEAVDEQGTDLYTSYTLKSTLMIPGDEDSRYVTGFGLRSEIKDGVADSSFIVSADNFGVRKPNSNEFFLTAGTVEGVSTVGIGNAHIIDLAVKNAAIDNLAVTNAKMAKLSVDKSIIIDGEVTNEKIGNLIESLGHVPGADGWRINKNGYAEFNNIWARGDILATGIAAGSVEAFKTLILEGRTLNFPVYIADTSWDYETIECVPEGATSFTWNEVNVFTYTTESGSDAKLSKISISFHHTKISGSPNPFTDIIARARIVRRQAGYSDFEIPGTLTAIFYGKNGGISHTFTWNFFDTPQQPISSNDISYVIQFRTDNDGGITFTQDVIYKERFFELVEYEPG